MTKKHFIALADVVRGLEPINLRQKDSRATPEHRQWERDRDALADFCKTQNPRFMRDRWLAYIAGECGPGGGDIRVKKRMTVKLLWSRAFEKGASPVSGQRSLLEYLQAETRRTK